jgi:hypothetical protein
MLYVCFAHVVLTVSREIAFRVGTRMSCVSERSRILSKKTLSSRGGKSQKIPGASLDEATEVF